MRKILPHEKILTLYQEGKTIAEIARRVRLKQETVWLSLWRNKAPQQRIMEGIKNDV